MTGLRIAVVGAGPAGMYAIGYLLDHGGPDVVIDLYERLATPWGLVRSGVAPDHPEKKLVADRLFDFSLHDSRVRFLGNVEIGTDISHADLSASYHAVIYAVGAGDDLKMNIPGEDLPGCFAARSFVAFYNGHPDYQHLDFDLDLAKSQTNENPVYYIQYAHARVCSVIRQWDGNLDDLADADFALLNNERELAIANQLAQFREVIESAARDLAPHMIAFYLKDLAGEFHAWYNAERMLVDDAALRDARVALAAAVRQTIRNGMAVLGVSCPESM